MDGLVPGRIVYLVLSGRMAEEINRRRTTGPEIADRIRASAWPIGAQAHIGPPALAGDVVPAMVVKVYEYESDVERGMFDGTINCKAMLDGSDEYWAVAVPFNTGKAEGSWHWMFSGQDKRYTPDKVGQASS